MSWPYKKANIKDDFSLENEKVNTGYRMEKPKEIADKIVEYTKKDTTMYSVSEAVEWDVYKGFVIDKLISFQENQTELKDLVEEISLFDEEIYPLQYSDVLEIVKTFVK